MAIQTIVIKKFPALPKFARCFTTKALTAKPGLMSELANRVRRLESKPAARMTYQ